MTITKTAEGNKLTLIPEGLLDTANSPAFEAEVDKAIDETTDLLIDFAKVEYISSSGLRVLLKAQKKMNTKGQMQIANVNDTVKEVFEITGFTDILNII